MNQKILKRFTKMHLLECSWEKEGNKVRNNLLNYKFNNQTSADSFKL
jgi:hypothetical protein